MRGAIAWNAHAVRYNEVMFDVSAWFTGLGVVIAAATVVWVLSLVLRDASIVDLLWGPMFVIAAWTYALTSDTPAGARRALVLTLVTVFGLRLALYLAWRNHGEPEDRRYQAMRRRQGPRFPIISLASVFWLQAVLAWIVSLPLVVAVDGTDDVGVLGWLGAALWAVGFVFEAGGDLQLARFKADPANEGRVMDRGFWRYTRHPNYFGDFVQWWAFWLIAAEAGGWWTAIGPAVMTVLLLRVSGVSLLERSMRKTRPTYAEYVARTNAFFPGPPKRPSTASD